jgi:hypothetical protein
MLESLRPFLLAISFANSPVKLARSLPEFHQDVYYLPPILVRWQLHWRKYADAALWLLYDSTKRFKAQGTFLRGIHSGLVYSLRKTGHAMHMERTIQGNKARTVQGHEARCLFMNFKEVTIIIESYM